MPSVILSEKDIQASISRIAREIAEKHCGKELAIVGLLSQGDIIARRITAELAKFKCPAQYGAIDISLYRDDISKKQIKPSLRSSNLPFSTDEMHVILVDDVLFSGRTIRAALDAIFDYGRPAVIELACLIDRGGRELPIQPNYVGHVMDDVGRKILVHLKDTENGIKKDSVTIVQS